MSIAIRTWLLTFVLSASLGALGGCATGFDNAQADADTATGTGNDPSGTPGDLGAQYGGEPDVPGRAEPRYPSVGAPGGGGLTGPAAFSALDANGDGFITREEVKDQPIEPAFAEIDQDRDGRVSPQEFGLYQESYGPSGQPAPSLD
jgi:hypothetical protein